MGAAVKVDGAIALELGSVLGFPGCLPLSGQINEPLPGLGLGACGVAGSSSLPALESPSAALTSVVAVAAEACAAGGGSEAHLNPCLVGPFGTWEEAVP